LRDVLELPTDKVAAVRDPIALPELANVPQNEFSERPSVDIAIPGGAYVARRVVWQRAAPVQAVHHC